MKKITITLAALLLLGAMTASGQPTTLETPTGAIYGTLRMPDGAKSPAPLAIIIAGSGPTDRDGNNPQMVNNSLRMLADSLAAHGIASVRYDKRGIAASAAAGKDEKDLRFEDYIGDARAWVALYAADKRFSRIYFAGHSEGSLIGIVAAQDNPHVAGVISIAGSGRPMDELLREQLGPQLPEPMRRDAFAAIDTLKAGRQTEHYPKELYMLFRPSVQPYLISCLRYDPCVEEAKLTVPILVVQGTTDIQVRVKDADLLAAANHRARKVIVENMNHVLKQCTTTDRMAQAAVYTNSSLPLDGELVKACVAFISAK